MIPSEGCTLRHVKLWSKEDEIVSKVARNEGHVETYASPF